MQLELGVAPICGIKILLSASPVPLNRPEGLGRVKYRALLQMSGFNRCFLGEGRSLGIGKNEE